MIHDRFLYLAVGFPVLMWLLSYIYLAMYYRQLNIFWLKIHETKKRNLWHTLFYFNHFLREAPLDTFYVFCAYWTISSLAPDNFTQNFIEDATWNLILFIFVIVIMAGSIKTVGIKNTLLDLLQFRARDDQVFFGAHWNMHFLSTLCLMLIVILPAFFKSGPDTQKLTIIFILFIAISLVLKTDMRAFTDRRWLMHGIREVFTFVLIAMIPFYILLASNTSLLPLKLTLPAIFIIGAILVTVFYYTIIFLKTNIQKTAETEFPALYLITNHFFEHFLDFFYMALLFIVLLGNNGV
jgi:hypothetical protein